MDHLSVWAEVRPSVLAGTDISIALNALISSVYEHAFISVIFAMIRTLCIIGIGRSLVVSLLWRVDFHPASYVLCPAHMISISGPGNDGTLRWLHALVGLLALACLMSIDGLSRPKEHHGYANHEKHEYDQRRFVGSHKRVHHL